MNIQCVDWQDVSSKNHRGWNQIFSSNKEGLNLSQPCPVCRHSTLHKYYQAVDPIDRIILGQRFIARGALWTWCSTCHSYEHSSAFVPDWWSCTLYVDESKLTHQPEAIEQALRQAPL